MPKTRAKKPRKKTLVLGVTGHRNIDPNDKVIGQAVREECRLLAQKYEDCEYIILSGLAEGADRLVAKIAMKELNAKLVSVLAVPTEEFLKDFETQQSQRSFRTLLKKSHSVITAPLMSKKAWRQYTASRNHQYAWEGAFIAENSDILFALWDGKPARGVGGTAHVVNWFLKGKIPKKYQIKNKLGNHLKALARRPASAKRWLYHLLLN